MELKWKTGPQTEPGNYVTKCSNLDGESIYEHWSLSDINGLKEMPGHIEQHFGPIPDAPKPPKPMKLFRRFNCVFGEKQGVGSYDPNGGCQYPYRIRWQDSDVPPFILSEEEITIRQIEIEWIDDET